MWIERQNKKALFLQAVTSLKDQVLVLRGARQVGKTSFIINALKTIEPHAQIRINLASRGRSVIQGIEYYGRDFFGASEDASQLLYNISLTVGDLGKLTRPIIVFIDEADQFPISLETIQSLAGRADKLKVIYTGSNLENIALKNAATGRKRFFDLYPITFQEFLKAYGKDDALRYLLQVSLADKTFSEMYHQELIDLFDLYLRLGGMPRIVDAFIDVASRTQPIPELISDLVASVEENVKTVLGDRLALYEYEDVLRKLALFSMETLKFSRLQVQHARRSEVKKLVNKTVGARVAHKIRLYDSGDDLSKYILFDSGVLNYLLNGSDLLNSTITAAHKAIQYETAAGNEILATLPSRDDLFYWKSKRGAQVEFMLKAPKLVAIDVKSTRGDVRSLDSCAVYTEELEAIIKISKEPLRYDAGHIASIPNQGLTRKIPLITLPFYLAGRLCELLGSSALARNF
ncbi:MAG: AAA family ATPase [bacterium]